MPRHSWACVAALVGGGVVPGRILGRTRRPGAAGATFLDLPRTVPGGQHLVRLLGWRRTGMGNASPFEGGTRFAWVTADWGHILLSHTADWRARPTESQSRLVGACH